MQLYTIKSGALCYPFPSNGDDISNDINNIRIIFSPFEHEPFIPLPNNSFFYLLNKEENQVIAKKYGLPDIELVLCNLLITAFFVIRHRSDHHNFNSIIRAIFSPQQQKNSYLALLFDHINTSYSFDGDRVKKLTRELLLPWLHDIPFDNDPRTIAIEKIINLLLQESGEFHNEFLICDAMLNGKNRKINFPLKEQFFDGSDLQRAINKIIRFTFEKITSELGDIFKMQLLRRVTNPYLIDQQKSNVCGVVTFVQLIAKYNPYAYVSMIFDLIENGECKEPFSIKNIFNQEELPNITVDNLLLSSFRNQKNILPFRPSLPDNLRTISGITFSYEIADWIKDFLSKKIKNNDLYAIKDTTIHLDENSKEPLSRFKERLFLLHSPDRIKFITIKENLLHAINCFKQGNHVIMMVMSDLLRSFSFQNSLFGIEYPHYISIDHINLHQEEKIVELRYSSWGQSFHRIFNLNFFLHCYRGSIIVDANLQLAFNNRNHLAYGFFNKTIDKNRDKPETSLRHSAPAKGHNRFHIAAAMTCPTLNSSDSTSDLQARKLSRLK